MSDPGQRHEVRGRSDRWLSLGPTSRLLGVDPDTVRRWAGDGRLRAYVTPGGHRRFLRVDVERTTTAIRRAPRTMAELGATAERLTRVYERTYRPIFEPRSSAAAASTDGLRPEDREAFRAEGRRLVAALVRFLDATRPEDRIEASAEAERIVEATADRLARLGADAAEAVTTFVAARRPFLAELAAIGRRRAHDAAAVTRLHDDAVTLLDALLVRLVTRHADARRRLEEKP